MSAGAVFSSPSSLLLSSPLPSSSTMEPQLPEVKEALQKRDIDDLTHELHEGFKGIHERQDTTNGKVLKNIADISELQTWNKLRVVENKYNKLIWYALTLSISTIVGLVSYIYNHH